MKRLPLWMFLFCACISFTAIAQSSSPKKTDVNKDVDIVKVYEQVVVEGYGTAHIYKELANAYYFKNEYNKAKKWFEKLFDAESSSNATLKHRYRQTLKALDLEFKNNAYLAVNGTN
jgi:hypothetical protein